LCLHPLFAENDIHESLAAKQIYNTSSTTVLG